MKNHVPDYAFINNMWHCDCSCRMRTVEVKKSDAQDWHYFHLKAVERARASLAKRSDKISNSEYEWYRMKEVDPEQTPEQRAMWKMLADGIEPRLPKKTQPDETLFDMKPVSKTGRKD